MIKINNEYSVGFDSMNVVLYKTRIAGEKAKNSGEEVAEAIGFYGKFTHLISAMLNDKIISSDCSDIKELNSLIKKFEEDILKSIIELKPNTKPYKYELETDIKE